MQQRSKWSAFTGALILLAASLPSLAATPQPTQTATASPAQNAGLSASRAPADLSHDSDPVPSPDGTAPSSATAPAQSGNNDVAKQDGKYVLQVGSYEVRLNASVIDGSGHAVDTLPESSFHVYEDGVPQTIIGFRHEDVPVSIGILIDSSGSMYDKRAAVDTASLNLVRLSNPQDEAFLVDFSSEAYIDQDFTNSIPKLQQGLSYIRSSGGTALYDAVIASADYLSKNAHRPKQVLLIVTDGDDNASSATLEQAIRRVQELDGPAIYCIGLLFGEDTSRTEARHSREILTQLSAETGGVAYFPKALKDVDEIAQEVAQDIRSQYTIEYRSTKPPSLGGYRQIHVEAKEKGYRSLQVRTRAGYFPKVAAKPASGTEVK